MFKVTYSTSAHAGGTLNVELEVLGSIQRLVHDPLYIVRWCTEELQAGGLSCPMKLRNALGFQSTEDNRIY